MSILSLEFLVFALLVVLLYYGMPQRVRPLVLTVASAVFISLAGWVSVLHLTAVALLCWGGAWALEKAPKGRGWLLALLLSADLGAMMLLKYQGTLANWLNRLLSAQVLSVWDLAVPLGLSYFTFQGAGYLIEVYRGKAKAQKNPLRVWLFLGYFPQLTQGPISTWKELNEQLWTGHLLQPVAVTSGFQLLLWGYFKKLVIADRLAPTTQWLMGDRAQEGSLILICVALYAVRLYMDFSGGMDVIRGLSRMLGIELPKNFTRPFFAKSVADYWRRWHITLGAWFRSYLLYPLSTSRRGIALGKRAEKWLGKKSGRMLPGALATMLVFLLIGVWHTASWNAVIYGAYFGVLMAASMLLEPVWKTCRQTLRLPQKGWMSALRLVRTWALVLLAQYFAFTADTQQSLALLQKTFEPWQLAGLGESLSAILSPLEWAIAGIGCAVVLLIDGLCERKKDVCTELARASVAIRWPLLLLLLVATLVFGAYGTAANATEFLYMQF